MQNLLANGAVIAMVHPDCCAFTHASVGARSVKENMDHYEYKHRYTKQPCKEIFTHDVLLIVNSTVGEADLRAMRSIGEVANDMP